MADDVRAATRLVQPACLGNVRGLTDSREQVPRDEARLTARRIRLVDGQPAMGDEHRQLPLGNRRHPLPSQVLPADQPSLPNEAVERQPPQPCLREEHAPRGRLGDVIIDCVGE
jgi:hypothetical protein